jgi:hypothetical protein
MGKARRIDLLGNTFGAGMTNPGANPKYARQNSNQPGAPSYAWPVGYPYT